MGNSQSNDASPSPSPSSALTAVSGNRPRERDVSQNRARPGGGSKPPTPTLASHAGAQQQQHQRHAPPSNLVSASSHRRARSATTSGAQPELREDPAAMGQTESKPPRRPSRSATLPDAGQLEREKTDSPSAAIGIPGSGHEAYTPIYVRAYGGSAYGLGPSDFSRPPRLPLPIESEHDPGSPLPSPTDADRQPIEADFDAGLDRCASVLSSTTLDDEDAADIEAFVLESSPSQPKVPTQIEYHDNSAKSVYVTGTFVKWERKFRLYPNSHTGSFSATFLLPTGTHHLKFLVDGDMRTSEELPTTVDFTNALVNYIEIVVPAADQPRGPSDPMPIPGTADGAARPIAIRGTDGRPSGGGGEATTAQGGDNVDTQRQTDLSLPQEPEQEQQQQKTQWLPRPHYTTTIPSFLLDMDLYDTPKDKRYRRAVKVSETLPTPPSLPGFMAKSVLNAATPLKDDSSVLAIPNHTVLNHLATSSIKNGVLSTSGTTRYKRKFLTTIVYKPTSDNC